MTWCDPRGSLKRLLIGAAALAVLIAGVAAVIFVSTRPPGFVTRSGHTLMLNGRPFRFSGTNIYWGGLDDSSGRAGINYPTPFRVQSGLQTAADMGETVIRCQTCGISTGTPLSVEPYLGDFSQAALEHIDYFIAQAQRYGMKVVIPLTDNYAYYLGSYCDFTNWLGLSRASDCPSPAAATAFYTSPRAIAAFEQYIGVLLNHVNHYTGVPNKDNPVIMAWETGNEMTYGTGGAAQFTRWTATIAAYIKSQHTGQLLMDGAAALDPGDLALRDVDIIDLHCYPISTPELNASASRVAAAGKATVVGEFGWNDPSELEPFLTDIQQTPSIAGDMYWDLEPQNDFFGYVEHYDGYQLHYPGDDFDVNGDRGEPVLTGAGDTAQVTELRSHAYAMSGEPVPGYAVPPAPVITNVEHVASDTAGTGNLLEWRGSPGAASYLVRRSVSGARGPWTTVARVSAAATATPFLDRGGGTGPDLWYQVTALSPAGAAGPASSPFRVVSRTLDDNLNNLSIAVSHDAGVTLDTSRGNQYDDDPSRAAFAPSSTEQEITWKEAGLEDFEAIAYYDSASDEPFTFEVSVNDQAWSEVPAADIQADQLAGTVPLDRISYIYTVDNVQRILGGASYVRILRDGGDTGVAEIGEVRITYP